MKRTVRAAAAICLVALGTLVAPALAGGPLQIAVEDSFFAPASPPARGVSQLGEEVAWTGPAATLEHNVHQDRRLFHSGAPQLGLDYEQDISAGRYHYFCQAHGSRTGGMDAVIRIRPTVVLPDGDSVTVIWADSAAEPTHRFEVQFRREGARKWKTWKRTTKQVQGEFGEGDRPINANPNRNYQIRVRTFVKGNRDRRSGWSPRVTLSVQP